MAGQKTNLLAQSAPAANTLTDILTVGNPARLDEVLICNQDTVGVTVRLSIAPAGAADATAQYLVYEQIIGPGRTFAVDFRPKGLSLGAGTIVRGRSSSASVSFNLVGE